MDIGFNEQGRRRVIDIEDRTNATDTLREVEGGFGRDEGGCLPRLYPLETLSTLPKGDIHVKGGGDTWGKAEVKV